jgi:hypothetical protein
MKGCVRLDKYEGRNFDEIMLLIKQGIIKCGKYSHLVKVDKNVKLGKELFSDGNKSK